MTGTMSLDGNIFIGSSVLETQELAVGITPATGHLSIYAKTDKLLYIQDDNSVETMIGGGLIGPVSSTDNAIPRWDGITGTILQDSILSIDDTTGTINISGSKYIHQEGTINFSCGLDALSSVTTGNSLLACGHSALKDNTTGSSNTAVGTDSLQNCIDGRLNTFVGTSSGNVITTQDRNTGVGTQVMLTTTSGDNVGIGYNCCGASGVNSAGFNVCVGNVTGRFLSTGTRNQIIGHNAGFNITSGSDNIIIGNTAGVNIVSTNNNIIIQNDGDAADVNRIRIGKGTHTSCFIGGIGGVTPGGTPGLVTMDPSTGELGTAGLVNLTATGVIDFNTVPSFDLLATDNTATAINIIATGGTSSNINIQNTTGVGVTSVLIASTLGSIKISTAGAEFTDVAGIFTHALNNVISTTEGATIDNAMPVFSGTSATILKESIAQLTTAGVMSGLTGLTVDGANQISLKSSQALADAIFINAENAGGGIQMEAGTTGIQIIGPSGARFVETGAGNDYIAIKAPAVVGTSYDITLPPTDGNAGEFLQTDGSAVTTWQVPLYPPGHLEGLVVSDASAATKLISAGSCLSDDGTFNIDSSGTLVPDISASGINGRDVGSEVEGWWFVFIIADSTGVNAVASLLSLSSQIPTLPGTHDKKRLISAIRNNAALDFYSYFTKSTGKNRFYLWRESAATLQVLSNGTAETWTNVDCSEFVPTVTTQLYMQGTHDGSSNVQPDFVSFRTDGSTLDGVSRVYAGSSWGSGIFHIETSIVGIIEYQNNGSSDDSNVFCVGFTLSL